MTQYDLKVGSITTAGVAGGAIGSLSFDNVCGEILSIEITYDALAPNTTTINILSDAPSNTILQLTGNTDVVKTPRDVICVNVGEEQDGSSGKHFVLGTFVNWGDVTVNVTNSDAVTDAVTIKLFYRK